MLCEQPYVFSMNSSYSHQAEDTNKSISHIDAESINLFINHLKIQFILTRNNLLNPFLYAGKVITLPPNIKTNPENKLLLKSLPYMSEPYDRQR